MIKNNLKALRHQHMMNQTEFAKLLGFHHNQYNRYEHNQIQPNLETACRICYVLQIPLEKLIEYTPEESPE